MTVLHRFRRLFSAARSRARRYVYGEQPAVASAPPDPVAVQPHALPGHGWDALSEPVVSPGLDATLMRIKANGEVDANEILPYLTYEQPGERASVNALLAQAYLESGTEAGVRQARTFAERAWLLSGFCQKYLDLYKQACLAAEDAQALADAYKRLGIIAADNADVDKAIEWFDAWHYTHAHVNKLDRFSYDFDIMRALAALATPYQFQRQAAPVAEEGRKLKIGYLVKGALETGSILVKLNHTFAQLHDKDRFEVTFIIPETDAAIEQSEEALGNVRKLLQSGCRVVTGAGTEKGLWVSVLEVARRIHEQQLDILVTSAALAHFSHYFITLVKPAPVVVGLVQGPPPQFAAPNLDWCIAWSKHPLMDSPVPCTLVDLKQVTLLPDDLQPADRESLGIPGDCLVLFSAGRPCKFQGHEYWRSINTLLSRYQSVHFVAAGPAADDLPFLASLVQSENRPRIHLLGWRQDAVALAAAADIIIDTFPSGGGQVLVEGMAMGKPVVGHRNDYMRLYDQVHWSPIEDFISDNQLLVARGDFPALEQAVGRLIENEALRAQAGERCRQALSLSDPATAVAQCEQIYERLAAHHLNFRLPSPV